MHSCSFCNFHFRGAPVQKIAKNAKMQKLQVLQFAPDCHQTWYGNSFTHGNDEFGVGGVSQSAQPAMQGHVHFFPYKMAVPPGPSAAHLPVSGAQAAAVSVSAVPCCTFSLLQAWPDTVVGRRYSRFCGCSHMCNFTNVRRQL